VEEFSIANKKVIQSSGKIFTRERGIETTGKRSGREKGRLHDSNCLIRVTIDNSNSQQQEEKKREAMSRLR